MNENTPLILVFYLDAEMMKERKIISQFAESVNQMIAEKNHNVMAFFLPTTGEERIECLNPVQLAETELTKVNNLIEDIKKSFDVGADIGVQDTDITPDVKPCECGNNPDGNCKCN